LAKTSINQFGHIGPQKKINELRRFRFLEKTCNQIIHCARSIGVSRKGDLRAERQSRFDSIGMMNPGYYSRYILVDCAEDGERLRATEHGLTKVLRCGVMRGEVRIGQAGSP
jgi:hypothetical protein